MTRPAMKTAKVITHLMNISMPDSIHSLMLLSSAKALNATIGAE